jgi:hypothetical protein
MSPEQKPSIDWAKITKPRSPWLAAFYLDLIGEVVYFAVSRSYLVIVFFTVSCFVVFTIWFFEQLIKKL